MVDLSFVDIQEDFLKTVIKMIELKPSITDLDLSGNRLTDDSIPDISQILKNEKS